MINFKSTRIRQEFSELYHKNRQLFNLIDDIALWAMNNLKKDITITHLYRTKEEHDALYAKTSPDKKPGTSPHQLWKAVDLRSYDFEDDELNGLIAYVNSKYKNSSGKPAAFAHAISGGAYHVHVQYPV